MNDKKVVIYICIGYFISQIVIQTLRYKQNKKELEKIKRINELIENTGEILSETIRESSSKVREEAQEVWDKTFDYAVDIYDTKMHKIDMKIFQTRKEAENYQEEMKLHYGKGYLVSIGIVSKG